MIWEHDHMIWACAQNLILQKLQARFVHLLHSLHFASLRNYCDPQSSPSKNLVHTQGTQYCRRGVVFVILAAQLRCPTFRKLSGLHE